MTTDNRTNEPTEAQIEAAARITELEQSLRSESLARMVDTTLLREYERRFAEAAKLHRRWNRGGDDVCMHCKQDTSPMPEPVRWPCPTAIALGLNE